VPAPLKKTAAVRTFLLVPPLFLKTLPVPRGNRPFSIETTKPPPPPMRCAPAPRLPARPLNFLFFPPPPPWEMGRARMVPEAGGKKENRAPSPRSLVQYPVGPHRLDSWEPPPKKKKDPKPTRSPLNERPEIRVMGGCFWGRFEKPWGEAKHFLLFFSRRKNHGAGFSYRKNKTEWAPF